MVTINKYIIHCCIRLVVTREAKRPIKLATKAIDIICIEICDILEVKQVKISCYVEPWNW